MKLSSIRRGSRVQIHQLPVGESRSQFIRIGLMEGAIIECLERLPGGTLVIGQSRQEFALSANLADSITVMPV